MRDKSQKNSWRDKDKLDVLAMQEILARENQKKVTSRPEAYG